MSSGMAPGACAAAGIDTFAECDAQNVPATSTNALNNHCAWTGTGCAVAWDLRGDTGAACETGWDSRIYDYNTGDGADPASVGLRATGGAIGRSRRSTPGVSLTRACALSPQNFRQELLAAPVISG